MWQCQNCVLHSGIAIFGYIVVTLIASINSLKINELFFFSSRKHHFYPNVSFCGSFFPSDGHNNNKNKKHSSNCSRVEFCFNLFLPRRATITSSLNKYTTSEACTQCLLIIWVMLTHVDILKLISFDSNKNYYKTKQTSFLLLWSNYLSI